MASPESKLSEVTLKPVSVTCKMAAMATLNRPSFLVCTLTLRLVVLTGAGTVVLTAAMTVLVPIALPARPDAEVEGSRSPIPLGSLVLLGGAALVVSVAGIPRDWRATVGLLTLGAALVVVFIYVDRRLSTSVLPPSTFGPSPLKWIYLTLGLLMAATESLPS